MLILEGLCDVSRSPAGDYNRVMPEVLIVMDRAAAPAEREAVLSAGRVKQSISNRVFEAEVSDDALAKLQSMAGVAKVVTGREAGLPPLDDAESLFVQAWISRRGQVKERFGEGLDWDAPGMIPPDPPNNAKG